MGWVARADRRLLGVSPLEEFKAAPLGIVLGRPIDGLPRISY